MAALHQLEIEASPNVQGKHLKSRLLQAIVDEEVGTTVVDSNQADDLHHAEATTKLYFTLFHPPGLVFASLKEYKEQLSPLIAPRRAKKGSGLIANSSLVRAPNPHAKNGAPICPTIEGGNDDTEQNMREAYYVGKWSNPTTTTTTTLCTLDEGSHQSGGFIWASHRPGHSLLVNKWSIGCGWETLLFQTQRATKYYYIKRCGTMSVVLCTLPLLLL